jgi:type II secretory pathway component PulC
MTNEEELIQNHKNSKIYIPLKTLYGSKYLLSLINLILICIVIILCIVSIVIFAIPSTKGMPTTFKAIGNQNDNIVFTNPIDAMFSKEKKQSNEDYGIISTKNIFSPDRKEWIAKTSTSKPAKEVKRRFPKKRSLAKKTKKFILHGIIITENIKKALINNPMPGLKKKRTLYVEEGDVIEGYRVISIEPDQIMLDWHGEDIIVELYSGLENTNQSETIETLKANQGNKRHREDKNPFADIK